MKKNIIKYLKIFLLDVVFYMTIALLFAIPWGFKNYPMQFKWNVFFVLAADTSGADSGTGTSILVNFVIPAFIVLLIYEILLHVFIKEEKKNFRIHKYSAISATIISFTLLFYTTKIWTYFDVFAKVFGEPVESEFIENNFVSEKDFAVIPPEEKRNLILIFLESMEPCLSSEKDGGVLKQNIIPNITEIAGENINFGSNKGIRGGQNLQGTAWTVAGLLSKTSGLPFFSPFVKKDNKLFCLPNHKKLGDFLFQQDYNLIFSMGSEKQFENRDTLLEDQHFEIHDIEWYKKNGQLPFDYGVFWGFEDAKLYDFAKSEITNLANKGKPFAFGMLTVDTHFPDGYTCPECRNDFPEKIENVFACEDRQLKNFIDWAKTQVWYKNTTIVILGDHAYLNAPLNNFIERNSSFSSREIEERRGFLDIFINPVKKDINEERNCNSFDMLPTILEAMGNKIEGKGMYLGRSLFSEEPSLSDLYPQKQIETETMVRSKIYESLK